MTSLEPTDPGDGEFRGEPASEPAATMTPIHCNVGEPTSTPVPAPAGETA